MSAVRWFDATWEVGCTDAGGKASGLGELTAQGLPIPPGFVVTTAAYHRSRAVGRLDESVLPMLAGLDPSDLADVADRCAGIRAIVRQLPMDAGSEEQIRGAYRELCRQCHVADVPVAVRSSATREDSAGDSFAGEHDTYLWVRGEDDVLDAVRRCWASLFTDRATCYRLDRGLDHLSGEMGVVVQKMVQPRSAGVAFTLNPANGDRSAIAIESSWGFGEAVVAGEVTPDSFLVDKVMFVITYRAIATKEQEYVLSGADAVVRVAIDAARGEQSSLTDEEVLDVARLARKVERIYSCPQDIEWAIDAHDGRGGGVTLLQARPETSWSRRPRTVQVEDPADFMSSIVSTLMAPLHAREDD